MSAADDALDVARFCWPGEDWSIDALGRVAGPPSTDADGCIFREVWEPAAHIAAAERVLVERGLGEEYGRALAINVLGSSWELQPGKNLCNITGVEFAAIRTAPLKVCLRAMARVVRENTAPTSGVENQKREST